MYSHNNYTHLQRQAGKIAAFKFMEPTTPTTPSPIGNPFLDDESMPLDDGFSLNAPIGTVIVRTDSPVAPEVLPFTPPTLRRIFSWNARTGA